MQKKTRFWVTYNPTKEKETYLVNITLQGGSLLGGKTIPVMFGEIACADPTKCGSWNSTLSSWQSSCI